MVEKLSRSRIFRDYQKAYRGATGLPLAITPSQSWGLPLHGDKNENPFCALMAGRSKTCAACLEMQESLTNREHNGEPITLNCFAGLCDTVVPIRLGDQLLGFLRTGQVFTREPTAESFDNATRKLIDWGVKVDLKQLEEAYFSSKILGSEQYESMVRLLKVFADHLSMVSNQILVEEDNTESPLIARARDFIDRNQAEDLSLESVAKAVNTSTFYFCKMFKRATGLTFTEYLSRIRVEKAKSLLLNPHIRISEVAFEVGFQSLSQFNRVFKKITGQSPSQFRVKMTRGKK
ncbi:MAG: PocR ligand-binding domain-containing protein [Opitutaceae bacterium]